MIEPDLQMYEETEKYENLTPWDGDRSQIPTMNTLVAIELASCGLVNKRVCGYDITYNTEAGTPLIRVHIAEFNECSKSNERMITDLHLPLTKREKALMKKTSSSNQAS